MDKNLFLKRILETYSSGEWEKIEQNALGVPINESNRAVLLSLRNDPGKYTGDVDEDKAEELRASLKEYLQEVWADEPGAHKYVIDVCLINTFLLEIPMHPESSVRYYHRVRDGKDEYFCPAKTDSLICSFCRSKPMDELRALWQEKTDETKAAKGERSAQIQKALFEEGFLESGVIDTGDIKYHDDVRVQCERNQCRCYGTTWACPPAVGTVEECRERVRHYDRMQLFSKAYRLDDPMDMKAVLKATRDFKKCTRGLHKKIKSITDDFFILSNESCDRCSRCTYPDAPCRFPDELQPSIEGYGLYVLELARLAGIRYINGQSTVTFFGAVVYNE